MPSGMQMIDGGLPRFWNNESTEEKVDAIQNYLFMLMEELHYVLHNLGEENINDNSLKELKNDIAGSVTVEAANIRGKLTAAQIDVGDLRISKLWLPRGTQGGYDVAISAELGGDMPTSGEINIGKGGTGIAGNFDSVNVYARSSVNFQTSILGSDETLSIDFNLSGSYVYPKTGTWDIGTAAKPFRNVYASNEITAHKLLPTGSSTHSIGDSGHTWYEAWLQTAIAQRYYFNSRSGVYLTYESSGKEVLFHRLNAMRPSDYGTASTPYQNDLGSADYPWTRIYGGKVIIRRDAETSLVLTCDEHGKLCVNGTPIH